MPRSVLSSLLLALCLASILSCCSAGCRKTNGSSRKETIQPGATVTNTKQCPKENGINMVLVDFKCESSHPDVVEVPEDTSMLMLPFPNNPGTTLNDGFKIYGGATCKCAPALCRKDAACCGVRVGIL